MTDTPTDSLHRLLMTLTDPSKFKKQLDELGAATKKHDTAKEQSLIAQKQASATLQQINIKGDQVEARAEKLDQREKALAAREAALAAEEKDHRERVLRFQRDHAERERDLAKRESLAPSIAAMLAAETNAAKARTGN
jgi:uncharacterized protein (DUF3084 family)